MIQNLLSLSCVGALAFLLAATIYQFRRDKWSRFRTWWDMEGLPIWILAAMAFTLIACSRGCIRPLS
jgi:hypothetical protein